MYTHTKASDCILQLYAIFICQSYLNKAGGGESNIGWPNIRLLLVWPPDQTSINTDRSCGDNVAMQWAESLSEHGGGFTPERVSIEPCRGRQSWWHKPRGLVIHYAHRTACLGSSGQMGGPWDTYTILYKGFGTVVWGETGITRAYWEQSDDYHKTWGLGRERAQPRLSGRGRCMCSWEWRLLSSEGPSMVPTFTFTISFLLFLAKSLVKFLLTIFSAFSARHLTQGI